jgi:proteasome lid subunit RPN8/RPN11
MIRIPEEIVQQIERHGETTFPEECCGAMFGQDADGVRTVTSIMEIDNSQGENRARRFLVTPQQYLRMERLASERGGALIGFYHSHPDHPARPSAFDTEHALPSLTYVIVSILQGKSAEVTAWLLGEKRDKFHEQELMVLKSERQIS